MQFLLYPAASYGVLEHLIIAHFASSKFRNTYQQQRLLMGRLLMGEVGLDVQPGMILTSEAGRNPKKGDKRMQRTPARTSRVADSASDGCRRRVERRVVAKFIAGGRSLAAAEMQHIGTRGGERKW